MKKILIALVAIFTLGAFSASAQKIAFFDYRTVMDSSATFKEATQKAEEIQATYQETMVSLQQEYETKLKDYQDNIATMPEIIRQNRERELGDIQLISEQMQQEFQQSLGVIQERYYVKLEEWLEKAVAIVGEREGYYYVMYYDEQAPSFWFNKEKADDLTKQIIAEMAILEKADPIVTPGQ